MKRTSYLPHLAAALLSGLMVAPAVAEIPDIDSSGWAVDPTTYGMTPREYIQAESRAFMADFIGRVGVNQFFHFSGLSTAEDKWVVSPNNDTIYSLAAVNTRGGFTLELPETGDRFMSIQIVTENHMTPVYLYGGGTYRFEAGDFDTDYVAIGVRTGTDGTPEDVALVVEQLHPQFKIVGAATDDSLIRPDTQKMLEVRAPLLAEYSKLDDAFDTMRKTTDEVDDWERFTYVTAGAWGLSADENAMYKPYGLSDAKGGTCYTGTYQPVPAKAFFSVTAYNADKYLMSNEDNIVSSARGVNMNGDGTFSIAFGAEECRGLAANYIYTPEDGWSFLMRAYRPDVEAFGSYVLPKLELSE